MCKNLHWSLAIICYPSGISDSVTGPLGSSVRRPIILIFNSLKSSEDDFPIRITKLNAFLSNEWRKHHRPDTAEACKAELCLSAYYMDVPQQVLLYVNILSFLSLAIQLS